MAPRRGDSLGDRYWPSVSSEIFQWKVSRPLHKSEQLSPEIRSPQRRGAQ